MAVETLKIEKAVQSDSKTLAEISVKPEKKPSHFFQNFKEKKWELVDKQDPDSLSLTDLNALSEWMNSFSIWDGFGHDHIEYLIKNPTLCATILAYLQQKEISIFEICYRFTFPKEGSKQTNFHFPIWLLENGYKPSQRDINSLPTILPEDNHETLKCLVKTFNLLGDVPFRIATTYSKEDLKTILEQNKLSSEASFLKSFEILQSRCLVAAKMGIDEPEETRLGDYTYGLQGVQNRLMRQELCTSIQRFCKNGLPAGLESENHLLDTKRLKELFTVLENTFSTIKPNLEKLLDEFINTIKNGGILPLMVKGKCYDGDKHSGNHGIGIVIYKNNLFYINKGWGEEIETTGIYLFNIKEGVDIREVIKFFVTDMKKITEYADFVKKNPDKFELMHYIHKKPQGTGNCGWASAKCIFHSAVFALIMEALSSKIVDIKERLAVTESLAYKIAKAFNFTDREYTVLEHLRMERAPEPFLLHAIHQKMRDQNKKKAKFHYSEDSLNQFPEYCKGGKIGPFAVTTKCVIL